MTQRELDIVILGGGLAGGLLAWSLKQSRPELSVLVLEASSQLGGNHTWSFQQSEMSPQGFRWLEPLITKSWTTQIVRFPEFERVMPSPYHTLTSDHFHEVLRTQLDQVEFGAKVEKVSPHEVILGNGESISAKAVFDCRGTLPVENATCGYQKFVGIDVELEEPHGLEAPIVIDATVPQIDGFRFLHVLPWTETSLLIRDTRYCDDPEVNLVSFRWEIEKYLEQNGWNAVTYFREEVGCLPLPLKQEFLISEEAPMSRWSKQGIPTLGFASGLFHPTTGFTLGETMRAIEALLVVKTLDSATAVSVLREHSKRAQRRYRYFYGLNRMLFLGALPEDRFEILKRFYRLSEAVIQRFYRAELSNADMFRLLVGRSPVPIKKAFEAIWKQRKLPSGETQFP